MVKKSLAYSLTVLLSVLCLSSCSKKNEYTNVIPADAGLVVSLDMKSMVEKSGLDGKSSGTLVQKFLNDIKSDLAVDSLYQIENIMKNPQESGLSLQDRIYLFSTAKSVGLVMKVADESKLKETFKLLTDRKVASSIESKDGFSWVSLNNDILCTYDKKVLLVLGSLDSSGLEGLKSDAKIWMTQKEENSIRKNVGFKKMDDKREDITAYISMAALPNTDMASTMIKFPAGTGLKDLMILASLNFEKGRIVAKAEMFTENKDLKKMLEERTCMAKTSGEFLDFFPAGTLVFLNSSLDGAKLYEMLAENPEFAEAMKNPEAGIDVKRLLSSFDGDISVGVTGFSGLGAPAVLAYAKMKGNYLMELVAAKKQLIEVGLGAQLTETGKDAYLLTYQGLKIYLGATGDYLYVTNNPEVLTRLNDKVADPITNATWASQARKSSVFFGINVAEIMKNPLLAAFASSGNPDMATAVSVFSQFSYINVFEASKGVAEMDIVLKNQHENVLKQIFGTIEAMSAK